MDGNAREQGVESSEEKHVCGQGRIPIGWNWIDWAFEE